MTTVPVSTCGSLDPTHVTAARWTAVVAAMRTSHATPATTKPAPYRKDSIKKSDMPSTLTLTGSQIQDVPEIMRLFRSRIFLHAPEGTSGEAVDYHSVRYLPLLSTRQSRTYYGRMLSETLEWRWTKI